jgi:hypothetical protein
MPQPRLWVDEIRDALAALGSTANLRDIYAKILQRNVMDFTANPNWQAAVRRTIQQHSSDTDIFTGLPSDDIFISPQGRGAGIWALRALVPAPDPIAELVTPEPAQDKVTSQAAPNVFVSHSHRDNAFTQRLVNDLRTAGADVWVDMTEVAYDSFVRQINEGMKSCQWLVLIMTPASLASPWVQLQVDAAIARVVQKRMRGIVPIVAESLEEDDIPPLWAPLHRYDATADYAASLSALLHVVGLATQ